MALIFCYAYQHHDPQILEPVANEAIKRGHIIMHAKEDYYAFLKANGAKGLVLVADFLVPQHSEGQTAVNLARMNNIPSLSIQHGIPIHNERSTSTADAYCLWGEAWRDNIVANGLHLTGNPTQDQIAAMDRDAIREEANKRWGYAPKALLVPMIRPEADSGDLAEIGPGAMARAEYYTRLARTTGWQGIWLVRPHPSDLKHGERMDAYGYIVDRLPAKLQVPEKGNLYATLAGVDFVFGTSTAVLEGLALGCRVEAVNMPYLPDASMEDMFYKLDGRASERVLEALEGMIYV